MNRVVVLAVTSRRVKPVPVQVSIAAVGSFALQFGHLTHRSSQVAASNHVDRWNNAERSACATNKLASGASSSD